MPPHNTLCCPDGTRVPILDEWSEFYCDELTARCVLYRKDNDIFYSRDLRDSGENMENFGTPIDKAEIFIPYESTMLLYKADDDDFDYIKLPPLSSYEPGSTMARECFAHELSVYEQLRLHPHPGICKYKGCLVIDGYVQGLVLERYRCTLKEGVDEGLPFDTASVRDTIANAVAHLHSLGLVHNDLHPDNIFLDDDLNPVIADMETCMPEGCPPIMKLGTPGWSENWNCSALANDKIALKRILLYLDGQYTPPTPQLPLGH